MEFSIITPTVQRESLLRACQSVNEQTSSAWEHIVVVDSADLDRPMMEKIHHPQRMILQCEHPHGNTGNTCRHEGWKYACGEWCYYLDDDNYLHRPTVLSEIEEVVNTCQNAEWLLFPILRHGGRFYLDPPQPCHFDTGNAMVRREIAQWPNIPDYASDVPWLNQFKDRPYKAFPDFAPIMVLPNSSFGAGGGMHGQ